MKKLPHVLMMVALLWVPFVPFVPFVHFAQAQTSNADVDSGRALYMKNGCFTCHGTVGQGGERGAGPRIAPEPFPFEAFKILVRNPRESMPRFDARFVSDDELQMIHRYLASIPPSRKAAEVLPR